MPWRLGPRKDAAERRNAPGSCGRAEIRGSPNGATCLGEESGHLHGGGGGHRGK